MATPETKSMDIEIRYVDLLKSILINTIYEDVPNDPWSDKQFNINMRIAGRDWPSKAFTMIGGLRMENVKQLAIEVIKNDVPGDFIETGVWRGGACIFMRGILEAFRVRDRKVFVADSFEGLPPPDESYVQDLGDEHHTFPELAVSLEQVKDNFSRFGLLDDQVYFLKGWFKDTLPDAPIDKLAILRLDGDMYESTMTALDSLYHKVQKGGFVIVDDYGAVPACKAAIHDFRAKANVEDPIVDIDGLGVYWRVG